MNGTMLLFQFHERTDRNTINKFMQEVIWTGFIVVEREVQVPQAWFSGGYSPQKDSERSGNTRKGG